MEYHTQIASGEWLDPDENWLEWTSTRLTAGRRRILLTQWYGEGYRRACHAFDFVKVFKACGSGITADGSDDEKIKLQGAPNDWCFTMEDANRDPVTGEFVVEEVVESNEEAARAESDEEEEDLSEGEAQDTNEIDSGDSDADSVEAEEPGEYVSEQGWKVVPQYSCKKAVDLVNCYFAYKFGSGWERGRVVGIEKNKNSADYGMYIVKFPSEDTKRCLALNQEDYDIDDIWVQIKRT